MPPGIGYPAPQNPLGDEDDLFAELGLSKAAMLPPMPPAAAGGDMTGGGQPEDAMMGLGLFDSQGPRGGGLAPGGLPPELMGGSAAPPLAMPPGAGAAPGQPPPGFAPGGTDEDMARQFVEKMLSRGKAPGQV